MSDHSEIARRIQVGDTVAYTHAFLDRQHVGAAVAMSAQGKVIALHRLESGILLAEIAWDTPGLPKRVNIKHLTRTEAAAFSE
jgi:hypothetical protein